MHSPTSTTQSLVGKEVNVLPLLITDDGNWDVVLGTQRSYCTVLKVTMGSTRWKAGTQMCDKNLWIHLQISGRELNQSLWCPGALCQEALLSTAVLQAARFGPSTPSAPSRANDDTETAAVDGILYWLYTSGSTKPHTHQLCITWDIRRSISAHSTCPVQVYL